LVKIDGLVLESKYPQLQYIIKGPIEDSWRDGIPQRIPKHIVLEFDRHLLIMDDLIREKELNDDDKTYISRQLDYELNRAQFNDFWVHQPPKPNPPWATYDQTDPKQIATVAQATGLVVEALRYENARDDGPRDAVVAKLEALNANTVDEAIPFVPDSGILEVEDM
jgi:hypothetical protein